MSVATAGDFIRAGATAVGAGADLVDVKRIRAGDAGGVTAQARQYLAAVRQARAAV